MPLIPSHAGIDERVRALERLHVRHLNQGLMTTTSHSSEEKKPKALQNNMTVQLVKRHGEVVDVNLLDAIE